MKEILDEISQISIYLKEEQERINEIALFQPLSQKIELDEASKPIRARKWSYTHKLPWIRRLSLKVQSFLFRKAPALIPAERLTNEAKFKTVLALLLAQEQLREFFFSNQKRKKNFFETTKETALEMGYLDFSIPNGTTPLQISQNMTQITGKNVSLIDDLPELNLQMAALNHHERNEILFRILNQVERPPITSILEVIHGDALNKTALTTKYAKYKVVAIEPKTGKIEYFYSKDRATSSIRTRDNSRPGIKGVMNQRCVIDSETKEWIGSYSGELSLKQHILEQVLFILNLKGEEVYLLDKASQVEEKTILLTSLFSWNEIGFIIEQNQAIRSLNKKILNIGPGRYIQLNLIHFNISFNASNKYPIPAEMSATIRDINDQAIISILADLWKYLGLESEGLTQLKKEIDLIATERDFLSHQKGLLKIIDTFHTLKQELISQLETTPKNIYILSGLSLLKEKKGDGKILRGMDLLLYINILANYLGYRHNKNCKNSTDRSAGANAADKASYAYQKIYRRIFLPGYSDEQETSLFKVLYSMYLVWEEPELNAALSTGFIGEKFYQNFFQENPEITQYLMHWFKKHPEIYTALSEQRS